MSYDKSSDNFSKVAGSIQIPPINTSIDDQFTDKESLGSLTTNSPYFNAEIAKFDIFISQRKENKIKEKVGKKDKSYVKVRFPLTHS
mmetsp:Transcript_32149/g.28493  ORF Transcript_32149/g.28493 Transcript_32149/m.28493 type:complete len:87 (+) Transcript_32149:977-1237(+)